MTLQGAKSRIDLFQEVILGNVSIGLNQHINNFEGISISQLGTSLSLFVQQIELRAYHLTLTDQNIVQLPLMNCELLTNSKLKL